MLDPRVSQLAKIIVNYSCELQKGQNILIESIGGNEELTREVIKEAYAAGGNPFIKSEDMTFRREFLLGATKEQLELMGEVDCRLMEKMHAYVGIRGGENSFELSDVPSEKMELYNKVYWHPVHSLIRVPKTKWVVLRYPNPAMSQAAGMSTKSFEDFYFDVCNFDYSKMHEAMMPLKALMEKTDKVRLVATDTDISFSIKDIGVVPCAGKCNLPDGEIYSAPIKDSVNGVITFNTPAQRDGFTYTDVQLTFKDGKIIKATSNDNERINKVLDTDEGARYVGEFAIGVNPNVTIPIGDTLFDEKIYGSIHFTPGNAYDEANNGNKSAVHWDLVLLQDKAHGGGEIYFDDILIRKDGEFVIPELLCLNSDNLK